MFEAVMKHDHIPTSVHVLQRRAEKLRPRRQASASRKEGIDAHDVSNAGKADEMDEVARSTAHIENP
jgi:hypothetical protein